MTRPLAAAVILLLFVAVAYGQTFITGDITTSQTWGPSGSPYIIQAAVQISNSSTLTIASGLMGGVTVAFDGDCRLETGGGSAIVAAGSPTHRVTFTSNAGTPAPGDWKWVTAGGSGASSFHHCIFEFAETGLEVSTLLPTPIEHCVMRHCSGTGLWIGLCSPIVQYCDMHNCRDGVTLNSTSGYTADPVIKYCNIYNNDIYNLRVFAYPEPATTIECEYNWWGTDIEAEIAQEIWDSADDPNLYATIDYTPWWMEQPVEETTWGQVKALFAR